MTYRKLITFISFIIINWTSVSSSYSIQPDTFVQSTVNRASQILSSNLSKQQKMEELKSIAEETVDVMGIGMYTLGAYRKNLDNNQREEYQRLFKQYFLKTFSSRLSEYSNPEIEVNAKEKINENYTMVSSILVSTEQRPEVKITWRIYTKNPNNPLIRDLIIEGLSLARTQKEEFASIIESNDGDFNVLFETLKEFIK
jgi:phospholipid transport system substrate-binding protein